MNALRAFEAAARHLSFSRAADELCVTQGAISRQVRALEVELGILLFRRMTRAVELTDEGRDLLAAAQDAFDRVEQTTIDLTRSANHKILTISVLPTFAMHWLMPRLHRFSAAHPGVEVRMINSILPVNFGKERVDLAIRVGHLPDGPSSSGQPRINLEMVSDWNSVGADMLLPDVLIPVCSPDLSTREPTPWAPKDLLKRDLLHMSSRPQAWHDWFRAFGLTCPEAKRSAHYGHFFMAMQAASEGKGVALVPRALVEHDISAGRLVAPVRESVESDGAYYVLYRQQQRDATPVRQFRNWLIAERDSFNKTLSRSSALPSPRLSSPAATQAARP